MIKGILMIWLAVIGAVLLDLWDGVNTAKRLGVPLRSRRLRTTIDKIVEYWRLLLLGMLVDIIGLLLPFYTLPYTSLAMGAALICIEAKSMMEHARRRRSSAADLTEILESIVGAATRGEARDILKRIAEYLEDEKDDIRHRH